MMWLVIILTLLVVAVASVSMNVLQWVERKHENKEKNDFVAECAKMEKDLKEITSLYDNEQRHRQWAVGRIQDQQKVINQLERNYKPKRKEARHDSNND